MADGCDGWRRWGTDDHDARLAGRDRVDRDAAPGVWGAGGAGLGGVAAVVSAAWSSDGLPLALAGAGVVLAFAIERQ